MAPKAALKLSMLKMKHQDQTKRNKMRLHAAVSSRVASGELGDLAVRGPGFATLMDSSFLKISTDYNIDALSGRSTGAKVIDLNSALGDDVACTEKCFQVFLSYVCMTGTTQDLMVRAN